MFDKKEVLELLKEFEVPDAEYWTEKEFDENDRAILAMMRFLRPLQKTLDGYLHDYDEWIDNVNRCSDDTLKAEITEMTNAGVSNETIGKFAYCIARMAFNKVLYRIEDPAGGDYDLENEGEGLPRWTFKEVVTENGEDDKETGRFIYGMHGIFPFRNY